MDNLKYILLQCGWLDYDQIDCQQDVNEFYTFLCDILNITLIEMTKQTYSTSYSADNNTGITEKVPFISLSIPYDENLKACPHDKIFVKDMLYEWLYTNEVTVKRPVTSNSTEEVNVNALNVYHIHNIPEFVALSINRFPSVDVRLDTDVIIQKRLCPFKNTGNSTIQDIEWCFHAAICHKGQTLKSGHYYSLLCKKHQDNSSNNSNHVNTKWYIFNDLEQPSLCEVDMDDPVIISQIKKECVFLIYTLGFLG